MTKQQSLDLLMLLSALESWAMSVRSGSNCGLPDYLHDRIYESVEILSAMVLAPYDIYTPEYKSHPPLIRLPDPTC